MKKLIKPICVVLCFILCLGLVLSPLSFAEEHNHECTGEDCYICQILSVLKLLTGESFLALYVMAVMGFLQKNNLFAGAWRKNFCFITPISRKVKLTI